jgi:hypothetical protein
MMRVAVSLNGFSHRKSMVAAAAPNSCIMMNPGASWGRIPANVLLRDLCCGNCRISERR